MKINKAEVDGEGNVVIQGSDNSEITINMNNPNDIRKFFIDFQQNLHSLPKKILDLMEDKNTNEVVIEVGANIYLSLNFLVTPGSVGGIAFGVTITNLTKENRFFNAPFFKLSVPFEGDADTFAITDAMKKVEFPKKLEYGEVISELYPIKPHSKEIYAKVLTQDEDATIEVIVTTTIGEIYKSNEYRVAQLMESFQYAQ